MPPEMMPPRTEVRSPSPKGGKKIGVRPLISSFTSKMAKRLWPHSSNSLRAHPVFWVPLGDLLTHTSPTSWSPPPMEVSPTSPRSSQHGWSTYSRQTLQHSSHYLERQPGLMTGAWLPTWNAITPWMHESDPSRVNANDSMPRSQISFNRCASVTTSCPEPTLAPGWQDLRPWTTTSSRGILMDA